MYLEFDRLKLQHATSRILLYSINYIPIIVIILLLQTLLFCIDDNHITYKSYMFEHD